MVGCIKMPTIYQVCKKEEQDEDSFTNEEQSKGNIPLVIVQERTTLAFYVSPDTTVEYILNTFHNERIKSIKNMKHILYLTQNPQSKVFEHGKSIIDYSAPFQSLSTNPIKILMVLNPENHLL